MFVLLYDNAGAGAGTGTGAQLPLMHVFAYCTLLNIICLSACPEKCFRCFPKFSFFPSILHWQLLCILFSFIFASFIRSFSSVFHSFPMHFHHVCYTYSSACCSIVCSTGSFSWFCLLRLCVFLYSFLLDVLFSHHPIKLFVEL